MKILVYFLNFLRFSFIEFNEKSLDSSMLKTVNTKRSTLFDIYEMNRYLDCVIGFLCSLGLKFGHCR